MIRLNAGIRNVRKNENASRRPVPANGESEIYQDAYAENLNKGQLHEYTTNKNCA